MISRTWHGAVPVSKQQAFSDYLDQTGVKDTLGTKGCVAAYVTQRVQGDLAHFFLCTVWQDMQSIMAYAGSSPQIAVTYPDDAKYSLISDPIVVHQTVQSSANPFAD